MTAPTQSTEPTASTGVLEDQLCFALYAASRAVTSAYADVLDEHDLTYPQYLVLLLLWERDGVPVRELGRRLHLTSATLSPLLTRLERAGRIRRERSTADARTVTVHLTDAGRALAPVAEQARRCLADGLPFTPDEALALRDLATRLTTPSKENP